MSAIVGGFGLFPPEGQLVDAWWGARTISKMIWHPHKSEPGVETYEVIFDFVPDRKQFEYLDDAYKHELVAWMKAKFEPWLDDLAKGPEKVELIGSGSKEFTLDDGRFHAKVCANASHGYCYMGTWMDAAGDAP